MKYLKTYNESIKDQMTAVPDEEILKNLEKLPYDKKMVMASQIGNLDIVKDIVEKYKDDLHRITITQSMELSLLYDNLNVFKYLIKTFKVNYDLINSLFRTSVDNGFYDIVEFLLDEERFRIDIHFNNEWAMRVAIIKGYADILKLLLEMGADMNKINVLFAHNNKKPIDIAKEKEYTEVLDIIEQYKNINI